MLKTINYQTTVREKKIIPLKTKSTTSKALIILLCRIHQEFVLFFLKQTVIVSLHILLKRVTQFFGGFLMSDSLIVWYLFRPSFQR